MIKDERLRIYCWNCDNFREHRWSTASRKFTCSRQIPSVRPRMKYSMETTQECFMQFLTNQKQYPTKQQQHGNLLPFSKNIKVILTRQVGLCWRGTNLNVTFSKGSLDMDGQCQLTNKNLHLLSATRRM